MEVEVNNPKLKKKVYYNKTFFSGFWRPHQQPKLSFIHYIAQLNLKWLSAKNKLMFLSTVLFSADFDL